MDRARIDALIGTYRDGLLADVLPFWLEHGLDAEHGGYLTALGRDGTVLDTDKSVWFQGRFAWLLATLYTAVEARPEWLEAARSGVSFLREHGFDADGRMFFLVTRDGRPLRKRRYFFSETFAIAALAAYARASGEGGAAEQALDLFRRVVGYVTEPGRLEPKWRTDTRPMKGLVTPMILTATAQTLREAVDDPICDEWIDRCLDEIECDFLNHEFGAVMETVGPGGEFLNHYDGRMINPGHAIEAGWFVLAEARRRDDARLRRLGLTIVDWSWDWGWDDEHGGFLYFRDVKRLPVQEYWHDMKFWWPQTEAILATLMAYEATGDPKYADWHRMVHDWTHAHFPDPAHGEWFGYLHRDGGVSSEAKGTMWKGPFHIPRMQLLCWQLLEQMRGAVE